MYKRDFVELAGIIRMMKTRWHEDEYQGILNDFEVKLTTFCVSRSAHFNSATFAEACNGKQND